MNYAKMTPDSQFIDCHGLRIHVACWGDPGKPALFLLHGMRDQCRGWDWIARALASEYRIFAPDLRGHGDSGWAGSGSYTLASYVLDLEDISAALGLSRFAIVGHSFGGAIGLRYTSAFPERVIGFAGIECIELPIQRDHRATPRPHPAHLRAWIDSERQRRRRAPRHYATLADCELRMHAENRGLSDATVAHLARHAVIANTDGSWRWKYDNAARMRPPDDVDARDLDEMLDAIACPVLLAYGTASWVPLPPHERLSRIRQLSLVEFPGSSHWLHHTSREDFTSAVRSFLSSLPKG